MKFLVGPVVLVEQYLRPGCVPEQVFTAHVHPGVYNKNNWSQSEADRPSSHLSGLLNVMKGGWRVSSHGALVCLELREGW